MPRSVLAIPLEEVARHLASNQRQDIKIVAPERLTGELFERRASTRAVKQEELLEDVRWRHSGPSEPNLICESGDFVQRAEVISSPGILALSFANEKAVQDAHLHRRHVEIYFSEHPLSAEYLLPGESEPATVALEHGGALIFGPDVVHQVKLSGLTLVLEVPGVKDDKVKSDDGRMASVL